MKDRTHDEATAELFQKDPAFALAYLDSVLEEGNQAELMIALRQLSKAYGGVARVAEAAHLNPTQLYRTLSPEGNPELRSLSAILKAMGTAANTSPKPTSPRSSRSCVRTSSPKVRWSPASNGRWRITVGRLMRWR